MLTWSSLENQLCTALGLPMRRYCDGRPNPAFIRVFNTSRIVRANLDDIEYILSLKTTSFKKDRGYFVTGRGHSHS